MGSWRGRKGGGGRGGVGGGQWKCVAKMGVERPALAAAVTDKCVCGREKARGSDRERKREKESVCMCVYLCEREIERERDRECERELWLRPRLTSTPLW